MKRALYLFICLFLVACGNEKTAKISSDTSKMSNTVKVTESIIKVSADSIISEMDKAKYKQGELLVKFKEGIKASSAQMRHQAMGARVIKRIPLIDVDHVKLPEGADMKEAIIGYMKDPNVQYAQPNYIMHLFDTVPNDPSFGQQWGLRNIGQYASGTPGADISAPKAWDIVTGSYNNVFVAVVDTGIDQSHPDLFNNVVQGYNFFNNNTDTKDEVGHGTHVAGIIGAFSNNSIGMSGVMWQVRMMPIKVCGIDDTVDNEVGTVICPTDAVANGIVYAAQHNARIINISLGTDPGDPNPLPVYNAIDTARTFGSLVIAAAGNENNNNDLAPVYPASCNLPNVISVAATDQHDLRATFSNYGYTVHVAAPGVYILSTIPLGIYPPSCLSSPDSQFAFCGGTSMSAPHVSGLAGLIHSFYDYFDYSQIRGTIVRFVDGQKPTLDGFIYSGGRINAYKALASLLPAADLSGTADAAAGTITIHWKDRATGEDNYRVEKEVVEGEYETLAILPYNSESYKDDGVPDDCVPEEEDCTPVPLDDGTKYTYRITAFNFLPNPPYTMQDSQVLADGIPAFVSVIVPLKAPSDLKATALSDTEIELTWTDNASSAESFKIERKKSGDTAWVEIAEEFSTTYNDTDVEPDTTYSYRVRAFNEAAGNSEYSNEASATTKKAEESAKSNGGGGGGGGCSIGTRQNTPTAVADLAILLIPLVVIVLYRRKKI
jgi:subtilisin family serine protease